MTYLDQLRKDFTEKLDRGFTDWELLKEIKALSRLEKYGRKLQRLQEKFRGEVV